MGAPIQGTKPFSFLQDEALRVLASQVSAIYDSLETTLGVVTNQSLKALGLFVNASPVAHHLVLRSDQTITVKLNSTASPTITVEGGIPLELHYIEMTDVFVTTTAASNPIKVIAA